MDNVHTFSLQSAQYARYRPSYPDALFAYLNRLVQRHDRAWDCATGNGQCAIGCADYFKRVDATDISEAQLRHAVSHPRVRYCVGAAEDAPFESDSFDLIIVAQAIHWFNLERFYRECLRLLRPGGVLAVVGYTFLEVTPEIDGLITENLLSPIDRFWAEGNRLIMNAYRDLPFPFAEIPNVPSFAIEVEWSLEQLLAYLRTWSAVKRYVVEIGSDPVSTLARELKKAWGGSETKTVKMPLVLRVGRPETSSHSSAAPLPSPRLSYTIRATTKPRRWPRRGL